MGNNSTATLKRKLAGIDYALMDAYGAPRHTQREPLDELIATILSQNTNRANSSRAYGDLRAAFPDWEAVMLAPVTQVAAALKHGGLANTKAARIQRILRALIQHGPLSLDHFRGLPAGECENALLAFGGVGPKTARCVMLFSMGYDIFPVDTHILRILKRTGVLPEKMGAEKAHAFLQPLIQPNRSLELHLNLIRHGREVCRPRNPACACCPLRRRCAYRTSV